MLADVEARDRDAAERERRDKAIEAARARANPMRAYKPLPHGEAFHRNRAKERWLIGANGSGKTVIGAAEVVALVEGRNDWWKGPPSEVWCGAISLADSEAVQRKAVRSLISPGLIKSWTNEHNAGAESLLTLTNGWRVRFKAMNQGRERWQGGNVALVWFDEEPPADVFDEGFSRTRTGGRIILTFTPLNGLKWDEAYKNVYLPWVAYLKAHPGAKWGQIHDGLAVFTAAMADNAHLTAAEVEAQRAKFEGRPLVIRARLYGEWLNLNEDAIVPVDKLNDHEYTWPNAPRQGWARVAAWIDSAFSKNETSDQFCISVAASDHDGRLYLVTQAFGRLSADERVDLAVRVIREHGCPPTYVQRTTPDGEFAVRLNDALMREHLPALVRTHPEAGPVPGKVERAHAFAVMVGNGQVYVHKTDHFEFRREAGSFPHAKHDDVFDSGMGALMVLVEGYGMHDLPALLRSMHSRQRPMDDDDADDDTPAFDWQAEPGLLDLNGSE